MTECYISLMGLFLFMISEGLAVTPVQANSVLQLIMRFLKSQTQQQQDIEIPVRSDSKS